VSAVERIFPRRITQGELRTLRLGLLFLVWTAMLALIVWGEGGVLDLLQLKREVANLQAEIDTLRRENGDLKKEIRRFQTDPSVYEGPAREMLLKKKPGEVVLYLPPAGAAPRYPLPAPNTPVVNTPPPVPPASNVPPPQAPPTAVNAQPVEEAPAVVPTATPDAQGPAANAPADPPGG
jgi:cell division protein FtsB